MEDSYCNRAFRCSLPTYRMPEESMPRHVAYKLIEEELTLDGKPTLNLATFVTTECEEECEKLMSLGMKKNAIDTDEYPKVWQVQEKCVNMLARLFNAPLGETDKGVGTACIGSSEAIMLATLAMKVSTTLDAKTYSNTFLKSPFSS
jgi:glutamate decarboxylase